MISANPLLGVVLHAIGALCATLCYTPQKKTRGWSWQTYWLAQASVCWIILPIVGAWLTIPDLAVVLAAAPKDAMVHAFLLGALYGVGGTAFGIAIRYLGFSLTYAIAIGLSCVVGTMLPPILSHELAAMLGKTGASWIMTGIAVATLGILCSGLAGWLKDRDSRTEGISVGEFQLGKGLWFAVLAGFLSAVFGLSLAAGQPIADVAAAHGAGQFQGNIIYIFSCGGAFLTTALYCAYLHRKHRSLGEYVELPSGHKNAALPLNFSMAILTGFFWYGQFFFYGLAHVRMGSFKFTSWAIHMSMLVLFSTLAGVVLKEWTGCRTRTWAVLSLSIFILLGAVLALTYGNYLGSQ